MSVDHHEIKTSISFADRTASLQAAAETDTVRALGELYAHIANLPESSKKRKLLKQVRSAPFLYLHHHHRKSQNIIFILLLCLSRPGLSTRN